MKAEAAAAVHPSEPPALLSESTPARAGEAGAALPSLTFLYPSRCIGGAQLLFARLAAAIAASGQAQVAVVDYDDGFLAQTLRAAPGVRLISYREGATEVGASTVIAPLSALVELRYQIAPAALRGNFLFWSIHPDNIRDVLYGLGRRHLVSQARARPLLRALAEAGDLVFMDEANRRACAMELGDMGPPAYLQIPLAVDAAPPARSRRPGPQVAVGWLGRLTYDKINSLKKLVDDISGSTSAAPMVLHVVGAGPEQGALEVHARSRGVTLVCAGVLQGEALRDYFIEHVDLGIAMGTSALEIGSWGIPVALVDYSLAPLAADTGYDWLFDTRHFTLGNDAAWGEQRAHTLGRLIDAVRADAAQALGQRCYAYVRDQHALHAVANKLVRHAARPRSAAPSVLQLDRVLNPPLHSLAFRLARAVKRRLARDAA